MIVKILLSNKEASQNFGGVRYNDNKIEKGNGELMEMKNFPSFIDKTSSRDIVSNYLKTISKQNTSIKKPQFHCALSTKGKEHSKEELAEMANKWMGKMGYGDQPYLVVYHSDTQNNHVHIVSSRVNKETGEKINHQFENLRSQTALREVMKEMYGIDQDKNVEKLLNYKYSNFSQFEKLLKSGGFSVWKKDETIRIAHRGVELKEVSKKDLDFSYKVDVQQKKQLYAILDKYKTLYSNKVFKVDNGAAFTFHSELQKQLKAKFGIEIVMSYKDDKEPFGYTIIDNKSGAVIKGSEVMKMSNLFEFSADRIDKKFFDILENYNITDREQKEVVLNYLNAKHNCDIKDYMVTERKGKVPYVVYDSARSLAIGYIRSNAHNRNVVNDTSFVEHKDKFYMIDEKESKIFDLKKLVGEKYYGDYLQQRKEGYSSLDSSYNAGQEKIINPADYNLTALENLSSALAINAGGEEDEEAKQKRKRRKR